MAKPSVSLAAWGPVCASIAALSACYRAPELTGSNQVHDPNVEATMLKDSGLAAQSWAVVDDYMEDLVGDPNGPGCAIGIARGGELEYLQGYGKARIGGENWSVGTVGAVGSVSKTFTAAAALLMHERGDINVNERVRDYLSTSNAALGRVPVWRLLSNSSGVGGATQGDAFSPDWTGGGEAADCVGDESVSCQQLARELAEPAVAFEHYEADEAVEEDLDEGDPGNGVPDQGVYSNVGYSVAGAVVDVAAADTASEGYEAWIWDNIGQYTGNVLDSGNLLSLALTHSWRASDIPHRARGYQPDGGGGFDLYEAFDLDAIAGIEGWEGPSGGWAMTIGDLTRFAVALNRQEILGSGTLAAMRLRWTDLDSFGNDYGMGMFLGNSGEPPYWHGGIIGGHTSVWTWWNSYQGRSLSINLICNRSDLGPFPLLGDAIEIASRLGSSAPIPDHIGTLPRVGGGAVNGRRYAMDHRGAWQSQPAGAFLPLTALRHVLLLDVAASSSTIALTLGEGVAGGSGVPAPGRPWQALGQASFSGDPRFATAPTRVRLMTVAGELVVDGFTVEGAFDRNGGALADVTLRGVVDARQAPALVGRSHEEVCRDIAAAGASCRACADGFPACIAVEYRGLKGSSVAR
jgi:CubicO group peptidase (beta-lactamase class C family)